MDELAIKLGRINELLDRHGLDGLLLNGAGSFAWATCGASSYINTASTNGLASLFITRDERHVVTTNIEAPRIAGEEGLAAAGWTVHADPWHQPGAALAKLTAGRKIGADGCVPGAADLSAELARLRCNLTAPELERFRELGRICAAAMDEAIRAVRPGQTEYEIAALLAQATEQRGAQAIVNLIATDQRIFSYRHPLPTGKRMEQYAMLVLCGRRHGLVCSITRLVHFGPLSDELRRKMEAVAAVDATYIGATRPGATLGDVFAQAQTRYAENGFADEWTLHHQGGTAAYDAREYLGTPGSQDLVMAGQAYAWNPSITGTKSEDTILVGDDGNDVITTMEGWPMVEATHQGQSIPRPAILEVD